MKKFSLLAWNVQAFRGAPQQLNELAGHIGQFDPDVFGIFEVEYVDVIDMVRNKLPQYDYYLTDGPQNKEILIAVRQSTFQQVVFSQKREFKVFNPFLRPGALISLWMDEQFYNILFLHMDSGTEAPDFGNRINMWEKIWRLRLALNKVDPTGAPANFIVIGDFNTMGFRFPYQRDAHEQVSMGEEIDALNLLGRNRDMQLLTKSHPATFNNGRGLVSDLDHVLASEQIQFVDLGNEKEGSSFQVRVSGWNDLRGDEQAAFIEGISDHSALYCEIC